MFKHLRKLTLVIALIFSVLTLASCDPLNNLINNLNFADLNNKEEKPEEEEFIKVTFSYNNDDYGFFSLNIKKGEKIYEPITPFINGYVFKGWNKEDKVTPFNFNEKITKETTIYASWDIDSSVSEEETTVNVLYNYNAPGESSIGIKIEKNSKTVEPIVKERVGYLFAGWYLNDELYDFDLLVDENIILTAKWIVNDVEEGHEDIIVTFNFNNDTNIITIKIPYGSKVIEPKRPDKEGYHFAGWYKDDNLIFNFNSVITKDLTLNAKWEFGEEETNDPLIDFVLVEFNYNIPNKEDALIKIEKGTKVLEPKTTLSENFTFIGWFVSLEDIEPYDFNLDVNDDLGLIAKWEPIIYKPSYVNVTFIDYNEDNELIINTIEVEKDFVMDEPEEPIKEYYDFKGWYLEGEALPFDFNTIILKDYILIAKWELKNINIRVSFMKNTVELIESVFIPIGSVITPVEPVEVLNNVFIGYQDEEGNFFDFSKPIFENTILYAYYYPSIETVNEISKNVMRGNVKIFKSLFETRFQINPSSRSSGSGVIIRQEGNVYYVLTNSHVISKVYKTNDDVVTEAPYAKFEVEDYIGRTFEATIVIDGEDLDKSNVNHDLAVIKFTLDEEDEDYELNVINVSSFFNESDIFTIVGQPHGQKNTITFGGYLNRSEVNVTGADGTAKHYDSVKISAPGGSGSSGSMVINAEYEIIGIVFAGASKVNFIDSEYMIIVPLNYVHDIIDELNDILLLEATNYLINNLIFSNQVYT